MSHQTSSFGGCFGNMWRFHFVLFTFVSRQKWNRILIEYPDQYIEMMFATWIYVPVQLQIQHLSMEQFSYWYNLFFQVFVSPTDRGVIHAFYTKVSIDAVGRASRASDHVTVHRRISRLLSSQSRSTKYAASVVREIKSFLEPFPCGRLRCVEMTKRKSMRINWSFNTFVRMYILL